MLKIWKSIGVFILSIENFGTIVYGVISLIAFFGKFLLNFLLNFELLMIKKLLGSSSKDK